MPALKLGSLPSIRWDRNKERENGALCWHKMSTESRSGSSAESDGRGPALRLDPTGAVVTIALLPDLAAHLRKSPIAPNINTEPTSIHVFTTTN